MSLGERPVRARSVPARRRRPERRKAERANDFTERAFVARVAQTHAAERRDDDVFDERYARERSLDRRSLADDPKLGRAPLGIAPRAIVSGRWPFASERRIDACANLTDGAVGDHATTVDDPHVSADIRELGEDVTAEEDRLVAPAQFEHELAKLDASSWIEIARRLVEDEDLRIVQENACELHSLLQALRELRDVAIERPFHAREPCYFSHSARRQVLNGGKEFQVLGAADALVDARVIGHVAEESAHAPRIGAHVDAANFDLAGIRLVERGDRTDRGRLAGSVGADETEHRAAPDFER